MSDLRTALDEKKAEAEQLLEIIEHIKNQDLSITKTAILKSAFVLLLYNMIESTTFLVIERIHEKVSGQHYAQLGMHMRKVWVEFFFSNHTADHHHKHLEETLQQNITFPLLSTFTKKIKLFSGNIDARKLEELMEKYGIGPLTSPGKEKLLTIKTKRNSVAHGEEMFKEACRDLSESDLNDLKDATFSALDDLIAKTDNHLNVKGYLSVTTV